jgi:hypothetical protein
MSDEIGKMMADMDAFMKDNRVQGDIEFPVEISAVESSGNLKPKDKVGGWVSIRLVDDKKTYLGVYLGELTLGFFHSYNIKSKILSIIPHMNPAIYVPDLKRVAWGCESWWGVIDTPEKLRTISDADIQNVWYVRALKELEGKQS